MIIPKSTKQKVLLDILVQSKGQIKKKMKLNNSEPKNTHEVSDNVAFDIEHLGAELNQVDLEHVSNSTINDVPLLSSTFIIPINENEKETQTSVILINKNLQTDVTIDYFSGLENSYTEIKQKKL